jgi:hypothetical protein
MTGYFRYHPQSLLSNAGTEGLSSKDSKSTSFQTSIQNSQSSSKLCSWNSVIKWKGKCKVAPVLNQAPHHDVLWGSRGTAPRIFNLGTVWRWASHRYCFAPRYSLGRTLVGHRDGLDAAAKTKISAGNITPVNTRLITITTQLKTQT